MSLCECGCGLPAPIANMTSKRLGRVKGESVRFIRGHRTRKNKSYKHVGRHTREHVVIAERALGKRLPRGTEVHHVNENKLDNRPENLVICEGRAYHMLLHVRTQAKKLTGNANYRKCTYCKKYDDVMNLRMPSETRGNVYHRKCRTDYMEQFR